MQPTPLMAAFDGIPEVAEVTSIQIAAPQHLHREGRGSGNKHHEEDKKVGGYEPQGICAGDSEWSQFVCLISGAFCHGTSFI